MAESAGGATFDRVETMKLLEGEALAILREEGVLSGLNLNDVARRAGVNRGLVYLYFGSRRQLIRSSLRRDRHGLRQRLRLKLNGRPSHVFSQIFRDMVSIGDRMRTVALLLLDEDDEITIMPDLRYSIDEIRAMQERDVINRSIEPSDVLIAYWTMNYGYHLLRAKLASELGVDPEALDERMAEVVQRCFEGFDGPNAGDAAPDRGDGVTDTDAATTDSDPE